MTRCIRGAVAALLLGAVGAWAQSAHEAPVSFVAHDQRPILTLEREHGRVRAVAERPLVYVYGDGRVRVDRPAYMINPGIFEYRLEPGALAELVERFDRDGVMTLDTTAVRAQRDAAHQQRRSNTGERLITTDATVTRIRIDFASYARGGEVPRPLANTLQYSDLQIDAIHFPDIGDLAALANAEKQLLALIDHPAMAPFGEAK
jgi:hypothetical protein